MEFDNMDPSVQQDESKNLLVTDDLPDIIIEIEACTEESSAVNSYTALKENNSNTNNSCSDVLVEFGNFVDLPTGKTVRKRKRKRDISANDSTTVLPEISYFTKEPPLEKLTDSQCAESLIVVFDVETTGLGLEEDVCQLSAVAEVGGSLKFFDEYVIPDKNIPSDTSRVNGITKVDGQLFYKNKPVLAKKIRSALEAFLDFLVELDSSIILLAHNCFKFDQRILSRAITNCGLESEFFATVLGMADSLPICREKLPGRYCYTLKKLVTDELRSDFEAHNSLEDSKMLHLLVKKLSPNPNMISRNSRSISYGLRHFLYLLNTQSSTLPYYKAKFGPIVSDLIVKRLFKSGLSLNHLKTLYLQGGADAVSKTLSAKAADGKPKITNQKRIISSLCDFLQKELGL